MRPRDVIGLCVLALLTLGVVMVQSALMQVAPLGADGLQTEGVTLRSILLSRTSVYFALALLAMWAASRLPVRLFAGVAERALASRRAPGLLVIGTLGVVGLLLAVYLPGVGREVNGSHRWVGTGALQFQPSEVAKWAVIVLAAGYCVWRGPAVARFFTGLLPAMGALGMLCFIVVVEDLGSAVLVALVGVAVLAAGGASRFQLAACIPPAAALVYKAITSSDYRRRRILAFLDPYADPRGDGYHMIQSMIAIANGAGPGRGLGNGLQKFGYLPEDHTDFLFAVVCEELGIAGASVVLALYAGLLLAGLRVVVREASPLLALLGVGVLAAVGFQSLINLVVVTGLGPTKGIALPLLSSGGTGWVFTAGMLGVLMAIDRTQPEPAPASHLAPA